MNVMADQDFMGREVRARLQFCAHAGRTGLAGQLTPHPFHITRPFHHPQDAGGMATLYLQSSSGGLYGDDQLTLDVTLDPGARVHLTSQASAVVHDARGRIGTRQTQRFSLSAGAQLDYLPDPAILMSGARLNNHIDVRLGPGAGLILGDAQLWHDPQGIGRPFGHFANDIQLHGVDEPLLIERQDVAGEDWPARTGGYNCSGMLIAIGCMGAAEAMATASDQPGAYAGVSDFPDRELAILRILACDAVALTGAMNRAWIAMVTRRDGRPPADRRK